MCEVPLQCLGDLKFILSMDKQRAGSWTDILPGSFWVSCLEDVMASKDVPFLNEWAFLMASLSPSPG